MALDPKQAASAQRFAVRAVVLAAPLVLAALAAPAVMGRIRTARHASATAEAAAAVRLPGGAPPEEGAPPAKPPEPPTAEQIEKAREASAKLAEAERGWQRVEIIAPSAPAAPGVEETAPFQGFGLSIESEPDGATVAVDGRALGETPLLAGLRCEPGATLRIRVARDPLPPRELTTRCRADTLVKLRVRLGR